MNLNKNLYPGDYEYICINNREKYQEIILIKINNRKTIIKNVSIQKYFLIL